MQLSCSCMRKVAELLRPTLIQLFSVSNEPLICLSSSIMAQPG